MTRTNLITRDFRNMEKLFNDLSKDFSFPLVPRSSNYPPMNITNLYGGDGSYHYDIEVALAGFKREEISINNEVINNQGTPYKGIVIRASKSEETDSIGYITHGIAKRDIEQYVLIGRDDVVETAKYEDGILKIAVKREIQEPKESKIEIL